MLSVVFINLFAEGEQVNPPADAEQSGRKDVEVVVQSVHAQEMVTSVGNEGLERTVSYNVASFTDIRDKKLEDVLSKMPGISKMETGNGGYMYNGLMIDRAVLLFLISQTLKRRKTGHRSEVTRSLLYSRIL